MASLYAKESTEHGIRADSSTYMRFFPRGHKLANTTLLLIYPWIMDKAAYPMASRSYLQCPSMYVARKDQYASAILRAPTAFRCPVSAAYAAVRICP